jgi:hypothetical protein
MAMDTARHSISCDRCGAELPADARYCNRCGEPVMGGYPGYYTEPYSRCSGLLTLLLCLFVGYLGIHRFYAGKLFTGLLWLITGGLFGIGWIFDLILIAMGRFRDSDGLRINVWEEPPYRPA